MATDTADRGPYHILLVEDNPGDVELTREVIEESGHDASVVVVGDGEPAMMYLRQGRGNMPELRVPTSSCSILISR